MDTKRHFPLILSNFWIKIIALVTMTFDHIGYLLSNPDVSNVFRHIGRLALPLFCFMIAEGAIHTKSFKKYALRLGIMASLITTAIIVSQEVSYFREQGFSMRGEGNIFIDLLLGALAIYLLRQKKWYFKVLAILPISYGVASFIATSLESCWCHGEMLWFPYFLRTQYGWFAVLLIVLFYVAHYLCRLFIHYHSHISGIDAENYKGTNLERNALNIISATLLAAGALLFYIVGILMPLNYVYWDNTMQVFAIFAGAFLLLYNGERGYNKKWFQYGSYLYYPIHMAILYLIFAFI